MILAKKLYQAHCWCYSLLKTLGRGLGKFWHGPWVGRHAWAKFTTDHYGERFRGIPQVLEERCTHCQKCVMICPQHCWQIQNQRLVFAYRHCLACGLCAQICPAQCLRMSHTHQTAVAANVASAWTSEQLLAYTSAVAAAVPPPPAPAAPPADAPSASKN
jgi:Pyruvate/2-oxoacid:ferredoxin oxidoreductase delta subunit